MASGSVIGRAYSHADPVRSLFGQSFANPALKQLRDSASLSDISVGYLAKSESEPLNRQIGDGEHYFRAGADAYIKHSTSTLWGQAYYCNGKQTNVAWNESSDAALVYPYFSADSVGGDLNLERYAFAGGYADSRGRWLWGGEVGYEAGLYYRNVDPRPRNVTGKLDLSLGAGYQMAGSVASLALNFRKYKQTNDIDFVSEMGKSKIYHLTGLGNHYARFAGEGESAYFDGYRYGLSADLYPASGRGLVVSADMSRFTFKKVLTELNKLPLCRAWHNAVSVEAGWKSTRWGAVARFEAYRRHGIENLFGDASSGIYPRIGEIEMYADNHYAFSLKGAYEIALAQRASLSVAPAVAYTHRSTIYADPASERLINSVAVSMAVACRSVISDCWLLRGEVSASALRPVLMRLQLPEVTSLTEIERRDFAIASKPSGDAMVRVSLERALGERYALGAELGYTRGFYTRSISSDCFTASIKMIF